MADAAHYAAASVGAARRSWLIFRAVLTPASTLLTWGLPRELPQHLPVAKVQQSELQDPRVRRPCRLKLSRLSLLGCHWTCCCVVFSA